MSLAYVSFSRYTGSLASVLFPVILPSCSEMQDEEVDAVGWHTLISPVTVTAAGSRCAGDLSGAKCWTRGRRGTGAVAVARPVRAAVGRGTRAPTARMVSACYYYHSSVEAHPVA